jgi:hypothetical protein
MRHRGAIPPLLLARVFQWARLAASANLSQIAHSAIDDKFATDRKGGFVGGEEDNGLGNVAGISPPCFK